MLFQYDSEELQLSLDKQNLELEQLKNTSTTLQSQIAALQKEQKNASKDEQLSYTVEIQSKEAQKRKTTTTSRSSSGKSPRPRPIWPMRRFSLRSQAGWSQ